jgi:Family of unknown function (DUF5681)
MPRDYKDAVYEVGYGKPPRHTRFVKGQSGNPKGRPPGAKNVKTLLKEALNETVIITEDGRRRKITKCRAITKQIVNQAAKGDWRGIKILLDFLRDIEGHNEPGSAETSSFTEADEQIIQRIRARLRNKTG